MGPIRVHAVFFDPFLLSFPLSLRRWPAGIAEQRRVSSSAPRAAGRVLTGNALLQSDVWRMIRRRALAAGIKTEIGCRTCRATKITADIKNGGRLEVAQQMAAHESARTAGL